MNGGTTGLPADGHVHSEWSWDAPEGSMEHSCTRAVELGLPAIAFTEHLDHTVWTIAPEELAGLEFLASLADPGGRITPPELDVSGYLEAIEKCRHQFPDLQIMSGLEIGEPHWHAAASDRVLAAGRFDRVLGSLHCLRDRDTFVEPPGLFGHRDPAEVVRVYLAEVERLVNDSDSFAVLAHIDYPIRYWPEQPAGPFDPTAFEEEFRSALRATAQSGRALEVNTVLPLHSTILGWWHDEGGEAITFGSDAHAPSAVASDFRHAAAMAEAHGFRRGRHPYDVWLRTGGRS